MADQYIRDLAPWPADRALPANAQPFFYDPDTDQEYRFTPDQLLLGLNIADDRAPNLRKGGPFQAKYLTVAETNGESTITVEGLLRNRANLLHLGVLITVELVPAGQPHHYTLAYDGAVRTLGTGLQVFKTGEMTDGELVPAVLVPADSPQTMATPYTSVSSTYQWAAGQYASAYVGNPLALQFYVSRNAAVHPAPTEGGDATHWEPASPPAAGASFQGLTGHLLDNADAAATLLNYAKTRDLAGLSDALQAAIANEATARANADAALQTSITTNGTAISAQATRLDTLVTGAPAALDTLAEIAAQLASDESGVAAILATQQQHTQQIAAFPTTTTGLAEGTNLYFTEARTLASFLTGLPASTGTLVAPSATDKILSAWGKVVSLFALIGQPRGLATLGADGLLTNSQRASAFSPTVEIFSTAGTFTWTKPTAAKIVRVVLLGGGGGGGGGCSAAYGTVISGGAGGGGGGRNIMDFDASQLPASVSITVGAGGVGGAGLGSGVTGSIVGNAGTAGGDSLFGTYGKARGGGAGLGAVVANGIALAGAGGGSVLAGGSGGTGIAQQAPGSPGSPIFSQTYAASGGAGGGGGSGYDGAANTGGGGPGGVNCLTDISGATLAATVGGGAASNGSTTPAGTSAANIAAFRGIGANGGAGGSSTRFGTYGPGNGGNGGFPAGGGGGAGSAYTGAASGTGGNGGGGVVIIYSY